LTGVALLAAVAAFGVYLLRGYDPAAQRLHVFGATFILGEHEGGREYASRPVESREAGHDDQD
jgi:hypothetical protein